MHLLDRDALQRAYIKEIGGIEVTAVKDNAGFEYIVQGASVGKLKAQGYALAPCGAIRVRLGDRASYKRIYKLV